MDKFPCALCHKDVPMQFQTLKPGDQFLVNCPHCGYCNQGGMGYPAQPMPQNAQALLGQGMWPATQRQFIGE